MEDDVPEIGERVNHKIFGTGTVGEDSKQRTGIITIIFDQYKLKKSLVWVFARVNFQPVALER